MENNQQRELVTKGLLQAFGTKCKKIFKTNPIYSNESGIWMRISTSLKYSDIEAGFNCLYLSILGITSGYESVQGVEQQVEKTICSDIILKNSNNKEPEFAEGKNFGTDIIESVVFANQNQSLVVYIKLPDSRRFRYTIVNALAYADDLSAGEYKFLYDETYAINFQNELSEPEIYSQIAINNLYPFSENKIGVIVTQLHEDPSFTIIEDEILENNELIGYIQKSYPQYKSFSKIFESVKSGKLNHTLNFQYDWENPISEDDAPVFIGDLSDDSIRIPIPDLFTNGVTTDDDLWAYRVKTVNGIVTEVDTESNIDVASTSNLGGMYLLTDNPNSVGDKVPVQIDRYGRAFIDQNRIIEDKHRDDLNKQEYQDNLQQFANTIWQHIGVTSGNFKNGYFYKCVQTQYTVQYDASNSPYSVGTQIGVKLENYISSTELTLDLNKPFKLYVDNYPQQNSENEDVKISELNEFKLVNLDISGSPTGSILVLNKEQLSSILDVTIKSTDGWDVALTKDYPVSIMTLTFTLNSSTYQWKQWDVQPRVNSGVDIQYITENEINYLFETHVTNVSLSISDWHTTVATPYNTQSIVASVLPTDASNQAIEWSTSNPYVAIVQGDNINSKTAVIYAVGEGECIITAKSVSEPDKTATCTVTVSLIEE